MATDEAQATASPDDARLDGVPRPAPPADVPIEFDPDTVAAVGKASEALEWVERARGHLYSFHQMMGHADFLFGDAVAMLRDAHQHEAAARIDGEVVGRNVLDGRWTFQIIEEFDDLYYNVAAHAVRRLEHELTGGHRHLYESWLKEQRRTAGRAGHERRPPSAHSPMVVTEQSPPRPASTNDRPPS